MLLAAGKSENGYMNELAIAAYTAWCQAMGYSPLLMGLDEHQRNAWEAGGDAVQRAAMRTPPGTTRAHLTPRQRAALDRDKAMYAAALEKA